MSQQSVVLIKCSDQKGLIYTISKLITDHGVNIVSNQEFVDPSGIFYMRTVVDGQLDQVELEGALFKALPDDAVIISKAKQRKKIVIFATKEAHCLGDLLIRSYSNELYADIQAVISNHSDLESLVKGFGIPFHFVDHNGCSRENHEEKILNILNNYNPQLLVLAKYMRILTPAFIQAFKNRIINIHHSFLPAFIGANPYRQAYDRGVKIIGATSHFVTADLDEGPIIAQSITPVNHQFSPKDMARAGRDVEKVVLAKALKLVLADRVFVNHNKTVIFE